MKSYSVSVYATVSVNRFVIVNAEDEEDLRRKIANDDIEDVLDESEGGVEYDLDSIEIEDVEEIKD